ncbi:ferritin-like protein [Bradyrhizobium sp. U87765 SZCCT0131]|uniref:ferritin-like domain-containing protein n=1 Tax=unclassified Bradyrhizobium TaxID=2631580 RepID=UPI001BA565DC|nr:MULTISPECIES: ferritin-like protein [unclassified Bradyrhizobium]MBR1220022.1 ferritin-like protein [Bradyrhizobium sp. U87765 SZCCT0131]MBR1263522.1 ferritin-like protein [Bradyrhizobium sp. U87765 SZCCT0134]MBR1309091.1 ferritin-like protein [Bradyrhizobium sp. U87765 SZCCT0110]MBR1323854.1 ferritin-like protein [Bradyrhizobium sp. U87765 SZCCT0109]MBR1349406.1 ferritin-like protein [Bradyrhizobium sp. U87765 SZCCT0048]
MLKLRSGIVEAVRGAGSGPELHEFLQNAVKLEHSTIPPYLTALYSIKPGTNRAVAGIIRSIVVEEMLHMTIAANVLNAIGGAPEINRADFIPTYPGPLPMMADDGLKVGLEKLSKDLVRDVFMKIEQPKDPKHYPSKMLAAALPSFQTIGAFYDAIAEKIRELGDTIFVGDPARQVVNGGWFPADELFPITNVDTAVRALMLIKDQGEGTSDDPFEPDGEPAHYYRFEEIIRGASLVRDKATKRISFSGAPVPFDQADVIDIVSNSRAGMYEAGSLARNGVDLANATYSKLLNALHQTFNGQSDKLDAALGVMNEFRLVVMEKVVSVRVKGSDQFAAPAFEFVSVVN